MDLGFAWLNVLGLETYSRTPTYAIFDALTPPTGQGVLQLYDGVCEGLAV